MDTITFRCSACQHVMKVGADKAGRKAKCPKCASPIVVPDAEPAAPAKAPEPGPALATAEEPAPFKYVDKDDDDDGQKTYTMTQDDAAAKPVVEIKSKLTTPKGPGRKISKKLAKITDAKQWVKVGLGLQIVAGGLFVWLFAFLLYRLPLVVGLAMGEEYAVQANERLVTSPPEYGKPAEVDYCAYAITLLSGNMVGGFMIWVVRFSQVIYLLMYLPLAAGYALCLVVPPRYGTKLQLTVIIGLAGANALFGIIFKLLPMLGVYEYTILPIAVPEIVMISMNVDRLESLYTFWLKLPVLEMFWTLLMTLMFYLEPALIGVFLRAVGKGIKSEVLENKAMTIMKLGFSQLYVQMCFILVALCGTSEVLLSVLRVLYVIGMCFFIGQLVYTGMVCLSVNSIVYKQLGDQADELLADDYEDKLKASKGEEEDEEEEEEDDDD